MYELIHFYILWCLASIAWGIYRSLRTKNFKDDLLIARGGGGKGGGDSSAPTPPNPAQTAAAQTQSNVQTAQANAILDNPTIVSPYGNVSYDQTTANAGGTDLTRPTQTITLSPAEQSLLNSKNAIGTTLAGAGQNTANYLAQNPVFNPTLPSIPQSINLSGVSQVPTTSQFLAQNQQTQNDVYNQELSLLQPQFTQQKQALDDQLSAQGIVPGSEEYDNLEGNFQRNQDTALSNLADQSVVQGYNVENQLYNNALAGINAQYQQAYAPYQAAQTVASNDVNLQQSIYNQNLNQLAALLQGAPAITQPASSGYSGSTVSPTDIAGITNTNYQQQLQAYNINQANNNAFTSGLFGIGASVANPVARGLFA